MRYCSEAFLNGTRSGGGSSHYLSNEGQPSLRPALSLSLLGCSIQILGAQRQGLLTLIFYNLVVLYM